MVDFIVNFFNKTLLHLFVFFYIKHRHTKLSYFNIENQVYMKLQLWLNVIYEVPQ